MKPNLKKIFLLAPMEGVMDFIFRDLITSIGGVDQAILLKRLAMRVSVFFAGRAALRMSKVVSARTAQCHVDIAK